MGSLSLSIVAAVNDEDVLQRNLLQSPLLQRRDVEFRSYRNQTSSSIAYNRGLRETATEHVAFLHQDVYLPRGWEERLEAAISKLDAQDPNWAFLGIFGLLATGFVAGRVWSSGLGKELGAPLAGLMKIVSADELGFVIRRGADCRFDEQLPSFHLYATDYIRTAAARGMNSYVADLPVVHNDRPVLSLSGGYTASYNYMRYKWRGALPLANLIVPVTASPLPLIRTKLRLRLHRKRKLAASIANTSNPQDIARSLGYERAEAGQSLG